MQNPIEITTDEKETQDGILVALGLGSVLGDLIDLSWSKYESLAEFNGVETVIAGGVVYEYLYKSSIIYRFISDAVNVNGYSEEDSFYAAFDGSQLTEKLATRGD